MAINSSEVGGETFWALTEDRDAKRTSASRITVFFKCPLRRKVSSSAGPHGSSSDRAVFLSLQNKRAPTPSQDPFRSSRLGDASRPSPPCCSNRAVSLEAHNLVLRPRRRCRCICRDVLPTPC